MPKLISEVKFPYTEMYRRVMTGLRLFFDSDPPYVLSQAKETFARAYNLLESLG